MSITAPGKVVACATEEEFKKCMSDHPGGLTVAHFWASWAPACEHMNEVLVELAKQYPYVTFLTVEAEALPDLSEEYEISAVPTFVFLKNNKSIDRLDGANAAELTAKVKKHGQTTSAGMPKAAPKPASLEDRLKALINKSPCMLFMKGSPTEPKCGFSRQIVGILNDRKVQYDTFDILADDEVRQGLKTFSNWPTYPQMYVNGELIGGLDIVREMAESGELDDVVPKKGDLNARLSMLINSHPVMLFMKGSPDTPKCGFSRQTVALLDEAGIKDYGTFDILADEEVRQGLKTYSNWPTYPQLYVKGELIGGLDILREMHANGELTEALTI